VNTSSRIIINLIEHLNNNIYNKNIEVYNNEKLSKYINEKCISKIKEFSDIIGNDTITKFNTIFINGVEYPNLLIILNYINKNDKLIKKLAKYNQCNIHGDLTLENILISNSNFTLIDPNNENTVSTPAVDYAKLYQSLHMGYEFLCDLKTIEISNNYLRYQDLTSNKTYEVYKLISSHLKMKLGVDDYSTIYFHEGIHFCRLLPYRARLNPQTALVFYAAAIRCFDVFIKSIKKY
jgi:tRNA A-37 threonylcarbamoyl transferase component Bud32